MPTEVLSCICMLRHVPKHVSIYPNQHKKETEENECLPNDNKHQFFKKKDLSHDNHQDLMSSMKRNIDDLTY